MKAYHLLLLFREERNIQDYLVCLIRIIHQGI